MDKTIQFIANYDDWVAVRKLKIEPNTDSRMVMEFLAGLGTGIDTKVEQNLRKTLDLGKIDSALKGQLEGVSGRGEAAVAKAIAAVNGRALSSVINEITSDEKWQKNEQKELQGFCRVYAMRKALKELGLDIDYSGIEIPGMKRMMKKKASGE